QRHRADRAPQLERHPQPALAAAGRSLPADTVDRAAAAGAPASRGKRPRNRPHRSLAPGTGPALAVEQPLPAGKARQAAEQRSIGGLARAMPPVAEREKP